MKYIILSILLVSCARMKFPSKEKAMRKVLKEHSKKNIEIDNIAHFKNSLDQAIQALKLRRDQKLTFASCSISSTDYAKKLVELKELSNKELIEVIETQFELYEVYGKDRWGEILLTSYYSPIITAKKRPIGPYKAPLYYRPADLVDIDLGQFIEDDIISGSLDRHIITARLVEDDKGIKQIIPFFNRSAIDQMKTLEGAKVIAYVRPIDAFFLHIQGSGALKLDDELIMLGYAAQNGHRYESIGKLLYDRIPKREMSKAKIEKYLATLNEDELYKFLGNNPSYVFFRVLNSKRPITSYNTEVVDQTTIAIDQNLFPLGSIGLLEFNSPNFNSIDESEPNSFERKTHLVIAHDTGGAIKGADRADLYWGLGHKANQAAGVINQMAKLSFIVPKNCQ